MSTVSPTQIANGALITSSGINTPINQLAGVINGDIDDNNVSSLSGTKIISSTLPLSALDSTGRGGWITGALPAVSSVTYNGNRSYDVTFASTVASILTPGMRSRFTRTTAAPTTCFSLDGTNDYYNDTTVAGMTFTDDFVAGAWVYLTSYATGTIISRYNGTSGWDITIESDGRIGIFGRSGGSVNYRGFFTYQSVPLNKWVHIAAQLDMSAITATGVGAGATTNYALIDGASVSINTLVSGTSPATLTQAGNLEVGSRNGGTSPFPGYIDQAFVTSAKMTQDNVRTIISQAWTSALATTHSVVSAYSNGSTTDINTTNANNLTAQNGATTAARSPFGTDANLTSGSYDFGIVTKVSTTTVTYQVPEGCAIPTSGGVTTVDYSPHKSPFGMPTDEVRWTISSVLYAATSTAGLVGGAVYNPGGFNLSLPIGAWRISSLINVQIQNSTTAYDSTVSLSTSSSSAVITGLSARDYIGGLGSATYRLWPSWFTWYYAATTVTPLYALMVSSTAFAQADMRNSFIQATCAYL